MKKRILSLLLALVMVLLCSCFTNVTEDGVKPNTAKSETESAQTADGKSESPTTGSEENSTDSQNESPTESQSESPTVSDEESPSESESKYWNDELTYDSDEEVKARIEEEFRTIDGFLARNNAEEYDDLEKTFNDLMQDFNYFSDKSSLAYVAFSCDTTDEEASKEYEDLTKLVNGYVDRLRSYYRPAYESAFRDRFFEDWTEEQIEIALAYSDASGEEFLELNNSIDAEVKRFQEMDNDDPDFMRQSQEIYYNIVHLNMQKAQKMGYDSYADYAYKLEYGRDYTPADGQKMYEYVKDYIVPLSSKVFNALVNYSQLNRLFDDYDELNNQPMETEELVRLLTPYYERQGGKVPDAFKSFLEHHYTSDADTAVGQAFTTYLSFYGYPICYFGPDHYQGLLTYIHEQGHYNAFYCSDCSVDSFDLCEVQSQGNEWLYMAYIKGNYSARHFKYLTYYHLYDSIITIMLASACDAFEQYVYAHPELQPEEYDGVFVAQAKEMGVYDFLSRNLSIKPEDYWHYAIVDCSMYYLSYAVSKVPSIEVYVIASTQGVDAAIETYTKLLDVDEDAPFIETITAAGLGSPFTEDPYKAINECF